MWMEIQSGLLPLLFVDGCIERWVSQASAAIWKLGIGLGLSLVSRDVELE
jgi:hypothetical protein